MFESRSSQSAESPSAARRIRPALALALRLLVPILAFSWLFRSIDPGAVGQAFRRIPATAFAASFMWLAVSVVLGVMRWRVLLRASGAQGLPAWSECFRLCLVGLFLNLLPGGVGGDVYRSYATVACFRDAGRTRALGAVMIERALGVAGLFAVAALAVLAGPFASAAVLLYASVGLVVALSATGVLAWGRHLSKLVPLLRDRPVSFLPVVERPSALFAALGLSMGTQLATSMNGYAVLRGLVPDIDFLSAMAIFPLGTFASYFPLTVAGAGARDAALVVLLAKLGINRADSLATSLLILTGGVAISSLGGIAMLFGTKAPPTGSKPD